MNSGNRLIVYPKDLKQLTGKSLRYCQKLMQRIKLKFGKSKSDLVTRQEVAEFLKLKEKDLGELY
jgi:hypothetical protein